MNADTRQKWLARMQDLAGDLLKDVTKFTVCTLILSALFDSMGKGWKTYAGFTGAAAVCFLLATLLTRNK